MNIIEFIDKCVTTIGEPVIGRKINKSFLQFFRYLICGGTSTLCDMTVLFVLTYFLSVTHVIAATISYIIGSVTNYTLNTILVFKSSGKVKKEFSVFVTIGIFGLLWTDLIIWLLADKLTLNVMIAKVIAVILVLNWNFFMRKKFVFSASEKN